MKALVYIAPNQLVLRETPDVFPKDGELKLRVTGCGICGSDVHGYLGLTGRRTPPMVMGHEFVGEVAQAGAHTAMPAGSRVAVYPVDFCGSCEMCARGDVHLCLHKRAFGVLDVDGAFAEYICVPEKCCFPVNDTVSAAVGTMMEPLAVAWRGVSHAGELAGKDVLVVGAGTIGLLALACIRMQNPGRVIVSDLSDARLRVAAAMGADMTINPGGADFAEAIHAATGGKGVDAAIEAVGVTPTVQQAMSALRFGGLAVWIGNNRPTVEVNMQQIVTRELRVYGSFLYGYDEFQRVVALLNAGSLDVAPIISREITLEQAPEFFHRLAHEPGDLIKVVVAE